MVRRESAAGLAGMYYLIAAFAVTVYLWRDPASRIVAAHRRRRRPAGHKNDLAGFVLPSSAMLLHSRGSAAFAAAFQGKLPEYLAYLGWPMLVVLAATAIWFWRLLTIRALAVTFAVLDVFSLGGTLLAGGHEHAWFTLPWYWLQTLPGSGSAIPSRFSIIADGAAAAMIAFGLDAARARWPAACLPAGAARLSVARLAIPLAALAAIAPIVQERTVVIQTGPAAGGRGA